MVVTLNEIYPTDRNGEVTNFIAGRSWRREKQQSKFGAIMQIEVTDADRRREKEFIEYQNKLRNGA